MTTSYRLEAIKELRAQKKLDREAEAIALAVKRQEESKANAANMARIAAKEDRIAKGEPAPVATEQPKEEPVPVLEETEKAEPPKPSSSKKSSSKKSSRKPAKKSS